jgi:ATP-dependent Clp protease adaptor protein ClpS
LRSTPATALKTKAKEATELGKSKGYPLFFTTESEE